MHEFSSGILTQLSSFLDCKPQGIICIEENTAQKCTPANALAENMKITAVTDEFECCLKCNLDGSCGHSELAQLIQLASSKREHQFAGNYSAFYLETSAVKATIALVCSEHVIDSSDQTLLEVFTSKISIALENAVHYQKMVSLEKAAVTDFLTGLYNRRQLLRLGIPLLAEANRNNPLTVSIINIDFFKLINEKYGHDLGDVVLKQVGQLMLSHFREEDLVSRYGGKEFCIIAPSLPANKAFVLFDNFRQLLENTEIEIMPNEKIKVTVSIGITTDLCPNLDDMIAAAESLLYQAKSAGRNCVFVR
jgi:diguanylate cyclase (GGDEF)-like protein